MTRSTTARTWLIGLWLLGVLPAACTSLEDPAEQADAGREGGSGEDGGDLDPDASDKGPDAGGDADADAGSRPDATLVPPPDGGEDNAPPEVTIDFPPPGVTSLSRLHARGRVSDPDGDAITSVVINGVAAQLDGDAWSAEVPLAEGENDLTPEATDARGASGAAQAVVIRQVGGQLTMPSSCLYDAASERMLVIDRKLATPAAAAFFALYELDLETDRLALLSGGGRGEGPDFAAPDGLAHDAAGNRVFVLDRDLLAVMEVDLETGARSILSEATDGVPAFSDPSGIAFDPGSGRVFVVDGGANVLFAIDADTGARSVLSDASDGEVLYRDMEIAYDEAHDDVIGALGLAVVVIDVSSGARTFVADPDDLNGYKPSTGGWSALVADGARDRVLLQTFSGIVELDLTTQTRTLLADPALRQPQLADDGGCGLSLDPATAEAVFLSYTSDAILRVPLAVAPGETLLSGALQGEGPLLNAGTLAWFGDQVLVADRWDSLLAAVDLETGDRTIVSDATTGTGPALDFPSSLAHDAINGRVLVLDGTSLIAVDPSNGNRTVISSEHMAVGTGPGIGFPRTLSPYVDTSGDRIIVVSGDRLMAVELSTGNRSEFSGPGRGTGYLPDEFRDLVYDYAAQRYIAIGDGDQVLGIDAATGNRAVISGSMVGTTGPVLGDPTAIAYRGNHYAVLVYDNDDGELVSLELRTGERRVLQTLERTPADLLDDPARGTAVLAADDGLTSVELAGRAFETLYEPPQHGSAGHAAFVVVQELAGRTAYAASQHGLAVIDLVSGEREMLPRDPSHPTGFVSMFLIDAAHDQLYGYTSADGLFAWDLTSGSITTVSGAALGQGPALQFPASGAFDTRRMRLLLADASLQAVVAIDLQSGDRVNLSGGPAGAGDAWDFPAWIRYDAEADRALVLDTDRLVAVDLETGARTTLSGGGAGAGAALEQPGGLVLDPERGRAIVRDFGAQTFVAIDLESGDRTPLVPDLRPIVTSNPIVFPFATELDYDASRRTIFALDLLFEAALLEIDELTGDWVAPIGRVD